MKLLVRASRIVFAVGGATAFLMTGTSLAQTNTNVVGQWEFNGDLNAEVGEAIEYVGAISNTTEFVTMTINGQEAQVMKFPVASADQGYRVFHGASPNGGGENVNNYTMIMDIMYPQESDFLWRALFQTREDGSDADMFVADFGGVGINVQYDGTILPNTWYRVAFAFDLEAGEVSKFINGQLVGTQFLGTGVDQRWSLEPSLLLFADNDGETAVGFINSLQFRDYAMTEEEITELGLPSAAGITTPGVVPAGDFSLSIAKSGTDVIITVDEPGTYTLLKADTVDGEYLQVGTPDPTGSFTYPITGNAAFFRVVR